MPSFFEGMKRMIQGKPVFNQDDPEEKQAASDQAQPDPIMEAIDPKGQKELPHVAIERIEPHENGNHLELYAAIQNYSQVQVFLDKITLLGSTREINYPLRPGQEREFLIFSGPDPKNDYYDDCNLQFRKGDGDYFIAKHHVQMERQQDGTYKVERIRLEGSIRDV